MFLGSIGLMDMAKVQSIKGGWVACESLDGSMLKLAILLADQYPPSGTSDAIFRDRPQMWDLLVDLGSNPLPIVTDDAHDNFLSMSTSTLAGGSTTMRARFIPESEPTTIQLTSSSKPTIYTKSISHTFSDKALWKDVQTATTKQDAKWKDVERETSATTSTRVWGYAYGAYATLCEVCWGFCAMVVGKGVRGDHNHSNGTGYIRLPQDGQERMAGLESDGEEDDQDAADDTPPEYTGQGLHRTIATLDVLRRRATRLVSKIEKVGYKRALSKDDMAALGLSAWSWVDVDFVRAMYAKAKRDREDRNQDETGVTAIQVENGWFRWMSSIVGA